MIKPGVLAHDDDDSADNDALCKKSVGSPMHEGRGVELTTVRFGN